MHPRLFFFLLPPAMALWLAGCASSPSTSRETGASFEQDVKPVLEYYCIECHDTKSKGQYGGLILETGRAATTTGRHAPVIIPGNPDASLLFNVLRFGHENPLAMPPAPDKISDEQLAAIRDWIQAGAAWPEGAKGRLQLPH
ncbi:MAG TPA: c-type cytochrome domain-containing protein [Candidatus Saccharimonadia bacterium]|nr:c-type cytochrome domain-containing protein [Candidatus Saccharimonadia bacterium]